MKQSIEGLVGLVGIGICLILIVHFFIPDLFAKLYVCFQIVVVFFAFNLLWKNKGWYTHTNTVASILTVIGVFGTFLGIFIGLQSFNIDKIDASIPDLLKGLRFAFLTSLVGIGSAILLKGVVSPLFQRKDRHPSEAERERFFEVLKGIETSGESNLLTQLKMLTKTVEKEESKSREQSKAAWEAFYILVREEGSNSREALDSIKEGQNATLAQLKTLTITVSENVGEIAAKVGEIATGQLIEALKEVIRDFNKNLTEQFGENFKQLNEAVEKTVVWQEQYRQQMDKLADEFRIAAQSIEQTRESVGAIAESSSTIAQRSNSIVSCAEQLNPILHTLNDQLEAFSELRQRALDAFPLIENRLNELTTNFSKIVQTAITDSHASMEGQRIALETQTDQLQQVMENTTQQFNQLTTRFSDAVETSITESHESMNKQRDELKTQFGNLETAMDAGNRQLQDIINDIRDQLDSVFERSAARIAEVTRDFTQDLTKQLAETLQAQSRELSNIVERNREDIENHVNTLNESLRKELTNSLTTLAGYLESLSNGFVQNYTEVAGSYTQAIAELRQFVDVYNRTS